MFYCLSPDIECSTASAVTGVDCGQSAREVACHIPKRQNVSRKSILGLNSDSHPQFQAWNQSHWASPDCCFIFYNRHPTAQPQPKRGHHQDFRSLLSEKCVLMPVAGLNTRPSQCINAALHSSIAAAGQHCCCLPASWLPLSAHMLQPRHQAQHCLAQQRAAATALAAVTTPHHHPRSPGPKK